MAILIGVPAVILITGYTLCGFLWVWEKIWN